MGTDAVYIPPPCSYILHSGHQDNKIAIVGENGYNAVSFIYVIKIRLAGL